MAHKVLLAGIVIVVFIAFCIVFSTVVNAKGFSIFCPDTPNILVTLKNDANIDVAKEKILKIKHIKISKITNRDEEWSRMVNRMDLPKMDNPFKNEFIIRVNKKADINEVYNKIKTMDFVENIKYITDTRCGGDKNNQ